jgi:hypothetical protein
MDPSRICLAGRCRAEPLALPKGAVRETIEDPTLIPGATRPETTAWLAQAAAGLHEKVVA